MDENEKIYHKKTFFFLNINKLNINLIYYDYFIM